MACVRSWASLGRVRCSGLLRVGRSQHIKTGQGHDHAAQGECDVLIGNTAGRQVKRAQNPAGNEGLFGRGDFEIFGGHGTSSCRLKN